ncbi:helix-turn-helix domain-containing protein [Vibrio mediterranei]|uniref:helix-turn-helix domain-containing protein n=1 Tax=Vibrio mediterranei TaxID=689 RepID=UPI0040684E3F
MAYWLGKSSIFLPAQVREVVVERYSIVDALNDVSVITEHSVRYCFFFSDQNLDERLLMMCLRICKNLDKKLILFHYASIPKHYLDEELVFGRVCLSDANPMKSLANIDAKLRLLDSEDIRQSINSHSHDGGETYTPFQQNSDLETVSHMLSYIDNHFTSQIREQDVAAHCHLSVSYFSRLFHRKVGQNFRDYVCNKRVDLAKKMLKENAKQQISYIAFNSGFNDLSYFSRMFKKKTGMSPSTYRNLQGTLERPKDLEL